MRNLEKILPRLKNPRHKEVDRDGRIIHCTPLSARIPFETRAKRSLVIGSRRERGERDL